MVELSLDQMYEAKKLTFVFSFLCNVGTSSSKAKELFQESFSVRFLERFIQLKYKTSNSVAIEVCEHWIKAIVHDHDGLCLKSKRRKSKWKIFVEAEFLVYYVQSEE
tara:strand:+ start:295 stop:615 length:321 start_codon:yes stop_codon:yes gene_type:complete